MPEQKAAMQWLQFENILQTALQQQSLIKISLGNKRDKASVLNNIFIKPLLIKGQQQLSFVYRNSTNDVTKNFNNNDAITVIKDLMDTSFLNADIFTTTNDFYCSIGKTAQLKIVTKPASLQLKENALQHDKVKQRIITPHHNVYLQQLGITTADGSVKKDMQDKYKQINRYVEIIEGIIKELKFEPGLKVVDMGSGKGYLTFALHDYLQNILQLSPSIEGIELRSDLVDSCNQIAEKANFSNLIFKTGAIQNTILQNVDILIALHACDTATDDAIYKGIHANAKVIICVPCCHKQIRKQMAPDNALQSITKHGILLERQAEMVTDSIRALLLEAFGYTTKVFEFIATEHTPKNVLIVGVKSPAKTNREEYLQKVMALKQLFNIQQHHLEKLLGL